ncbi:MAG: hypothetical protein K6C13_15570 [Oscillospiraceae bacterium]|nr:hypothetical protein [Oscillospiraceae bacterium]
MTFNERNEVYDVNNNYEFYGFETAFTGKNNDTVVDFLRSKPYMEIYENDSRAEVVEEIVRRNGEFYDYQNAKDLTPWKLTETEMCFARFGYLPDETRPPNPGYAEYDWVVLNPIQFLYGVFLQQMIAQGSLRIENIVNKRPGRKRAE